MKKLYLIDVSSMFFRAFYAIRPLTSPTGQPVNAIYGFLSMVIKLLKQEKPEYIVFCYDRKEPSFRHEMYSEYKAHRSEMPEDLVKQMPYLKQVAGLLGIPSLEIPTYEADDLIGTLTHLGMKKKMEVYIVSGDKDFGQLIGPGVYLYDTMKGVKYDVDGVKEKWGVTPSQFIDYLALVGDSSDNIPGVRGIGPKGAISLLEQFETVEDIYKNIDKISSKAVKEKLLASKDNAFLSKKLVTICIDCEVDPNIESYHLQPLKREELKNFLRELNFKALEKTLLGEQDFEAVAPAVEVKITSHFVAAKAHVRSMNLAEVSKWLKPHEEVWGFVDSRGLFMAKQEELVHFQDDLTTLGTLTDEFKIQWKGYDIKSFWHHIKASNPLAIWDSMLAAYVLKAGDVGDFKTVLKEYLQTEHPEFVAVEEVYQTHLMLENHLKSKIAENRAESVLTELDIPLTPILYKMEKKGIRIDEEFLKRQSLELAKEVSALEKQIHATSGQTFNVASPKQLAVVLFEKMQLPTARKTKTGYSTDNEVLEKIEHPISKLILQYRELSKLKSTYVDAIPLLADDQGRVHTTFNQALTSTGRLSSINPNLQNIPIRTLRGQQVRKAFIADEGCELLSADYSQIELRVLAHITNDPNLKKAFEEDLDIHAATASEIFNVPLKEVTPEHRRKAKAVNFGIAYGQGIFGLAETLAIPRSEAQEIIVRYFDRFKNVREYIESTIAEATEKGYVETMAGRRRYIPELQSKNHAMKKFGERAAINAPIQGTASDLVKKAMIDLAAIPTHLEMLLQVHDELIFEGKDKNIQKELPEITRVMEAVGNLSVPLKVNTGIGKNWDEAH
jgi:DNA polymerase-1